MADEVIGSASSGDPLRVRGELPPSSDSHQGGAEGGLGPRGVERPVVGRLWPWALLASVLAGVLAVSGLGLMFFYRPAVDASMVSLVDLRQATGFGFLRDLHYWSAQGLLIAVWLHVARVFVIGSYRQRGRWRVTLALLVLATLQMWLGGSLTSSWAPGEDRALLAVYVAHLMLVPLAAGGLVAAWARLGNRRPDKHTGKHPGDRTGQREEVR